MDEHIEDLYHTIIINIYKKDKKEYNDDLFTLFIIIDDYLTNHIEVTDKFETYSTLINHEMTNELNHICYNVSKAKYMSYKDTNKTLDLAHEAYQMILKHKEMLSTGNLIYLGLKCVWMLADVEQYAEAIHMCKELITFVDDSDDIENYLLAIAELSHLYYDTNQVFDGDSYYELFNEKYDQASQDVQDHLYFAKKAIQYNKDRFK